MLEPVVTASGIKLASELSTAEMRPEWRKATRNMKMAAISIERTGLSFGDNVALVLGSNSGELETTAEFLNTLERTGVARPVLFQNSLHNATAGFLSIQFGFHGPSFSVSCAQQTPGESVQLALSLLAAGACNSCVVTLVEAHQNLSAQLGVTVSEGAATLVFSLRENGSEQAELIERLKNSTYPSLPGLAPFTAITDSLFFATAKRLSL